MTWTKSGALLDELAMTMTWTKSGALMDELANPLPLNFETSSKGFDSRTKLTCFLWYEYEQVQKIIQLAKTSRGAQLDFTRSANTSGPPRAGSKWPRAAAAFLVRCPSILPNCLPTVVPACNAFCLARLLIKMQDQARNGQF